MMFFHQKICGILSITLVRQMFTITYVNVAGSWADREYLNCIYIKIFV